MKTTADAVRSVKRFVSEVLNGQTPPLVEAFWLDPADNSEVRFSPGFVTADVDVTRPQWLELLGLPRYAGTAAHVSPEGWPYRAVRLADDPRLTHILGTTPITSGRLERPVEWEVRLDHDRGEFEYPIAFVKAAGPTLTAGTVWVAELTQPMAIIAYPTPPDEATGDAGATQLAAERTRDSLIQALVAGVGGLPRWPAGTPGGRGGEFISGDEFARRAAPGDRPLRIPLYDYDGVGLNEGSSQRQDNDYLRVMDASVNLLPEPQEPRQIAVVCDLRVNWRRDAMNDRGHKIVKEVRLEQVFA